jgi:hypothetical protein
MNYAQGHLIDSNDCRQGKCRLYLLHQAAVRIQAFKIDCCKWLIAESVHGMLNTSTSAHV